MFVNTAEGTRVLLTVGETNYYGEDMKKAGSETLLPMIDSLLKKADLALSDIDVFGVCVGPGSFTGLRIGLTTVKTFCYALGKRCFAVNNLRLGSYKVNGGKALCVADAGNNVCYVARYDGDIEVEPPTCVTLADAKLLAEKYPDHTVVTDCKSASAFNGVCGVGEAEMLVALKKHISVATDQKDIVPLYIRKAQPERGAGDL
ncbi:MAG: tRNA (adenosine(37)-N6)-threonylcarbamoyltransferase complex dimerization subunit type 1 TsaB [Roseburia sp.]|nr:tRNA (adenosine(37)-N6)-threonylcarbamoyltransferase complex dimerization subunit type 1 TsaB [Roseburia sp.]